MHAIEENVNQRYRRSKRNNESAFKETSKDLFKVVVNNYRRPENDPGDRVADRNENFETAGLPPQPSRYLKFPSYDWF